tara:strand:- start:5678 stop:5896 length:219 start_codon:yes stop_codon:yes gene_type:complete
MLGFFGHYKTETELEDAMVNTFMDNPEPYLRAFARRVISRDMKCIADSTGITVFWSEEAHRNIENGRFENEN